MLLFFRPVSWPGWRVLAGIVGPAMIVGGWWSLAAGEAGSGILAGVVLLLFAAADTWLLRALPLRGLSYGPWQAQLYALYVPRLFAALVVGTAVWPLGAAGALLLLAVVQLIGLFVLIWGAVIEPFRLSLTHLEVESPRLDGAAKAVRILHISDLHIERLTKRETRLLELVEEAAADLILITGDYLNLSYVHDRQAQEDVRRLLSRLAAPHGVYAILGSPPVDERDVVPPLFEGLPIRLLVDEWATVEMGDGRRLILLGMDCTHRIPVDAARLADLVTQAPDTAPRILMYHAPDLMPQAADHGLDLYLCGHTHGGQVRLPFYGALLTSSQLGKRYEMGLYQEQGTTLYVSRGVGLEGLSAPRVRFLAPPEIVLVTLRGSG